MQITKALLSVFVLAMAVLPVQAKGLPFTGNWVSKQFSNGKRFDLRLQQVDKSNLIGWEGQLPASSANIAPDFKGTICGKIADLEIQHRRGYKAHARLELRSNKLLWHLMESDGKSSRYFPLASTLQKRDEDIATDSADTAAKSGEQVLWDILWHAQTFENGNVGEGAESSAYFNAYKALVAHGVTADDTALQSLLKSDSPAGRLYAAAILWDLDKNAGLAAFKSLQVDKSAVSYQSGSKGYPTTVSEVASSFLEKGSFLDFSSKRYK